MKESIYKANADALEGLVWEWEAALDSRTCPTCMPLDQHRWKQGEKRLDWPVHPNCRCQCVLVDPEDTEFADQARTAVVIREKQKGPYKQTKSGKAYKTPVKVNELGVLPEDHHRHRRHGQPRYADVLAKWATDSTPALSRPWVSSVRRSSSGSWMSSTETRNRSSIGCSPVSQASSSGSHCRNLPRNGHLEDELLVNT